MRIAIVASLVSPIRAAESNGPHSVIVDLARGLARRGHRVTVYAAAGSAVEDVDVAQIFVEPIAQQARVRFDTKVEQAATAALNRGFVRLFARLRRDSPDVISQHAFDALAFELTEDLPVLHTLHLPPLVEDVVAAARATRAPLATVSVASREAWQRVGIPELLVLRNGVPDRSPARGAIVPVALIAGRISPEKGTHIAIDAARRAGLGVLVVGDRYDPDYFASLVEPRLRPGEWIGPVARDVLFQLMARCAVLLMPVSVEEPFGLVAAEAQMAGCPVVAYRRGALPEVVRHRVGGWLVEPDDEGELVPAIHLARGLDRATIRRRARREFDLDRMVDAYVHALASVAAGGRSAALAS